MAAINIVKKTHTGFVALMVETTKSTSSEL
jgi:hypothetical protein